jgi:hypothetical protein
LRTLLWTAPSFLLSAEAHFYGALSHAASCDAAFPVQYQQHIEALTAHHKQIAEWAENCPENFENRAALVGAEIARLEDRELDAERLYEAAIKSAVRNEFVHNEALANQLAARFYAARGFETIARAYLREARSCYLRWGAEGKVRQLDTLHPYVREGAPATAEVATTTARLEQLDLATVIRVSQAVSSEIVLEKLIDTLMRTAIEQAGAERGLLIIPHGGEPKVAAEATTNGDTIIVHLRDEAVVDGLLPASVLQYVLRTQESVIIDDATNQAAFAADPYISQHEARPSAAILGVRSQRPHALPRDRAADEGWPAEAARFSERARRLGHSYGRTIDPQTQVFGSWPVSSPLTSLSPGPRGGQP